MKLKKQKLKLYKILLLLLFVFIFIIGIRFIFIKIFYISRSQEMNVPAKYIKVDNPLNLSISFNNKVGVKGAIDDFVKSIDKAKHTIELAVFSVDSNKIRLALYRANIRGVKVTMVLDTSRAEQHNKVFADLPYNIKRIDNGTADSINSKNQVYMHHKFMIVDRNYPTAELISGSLNFTDIGEKYNESFYITTADSTLISVYGNEFDLLKDKVTGVLKLAKINYEPWAANIKYTNSFLELWMSPGFSQHSVKYRIMQLINSATSSIDLLMWDFTDTTIAKALIKKSESGIPIRVITENTNATSSSSVIPLLITAKEDKKLNNLEIILDTKSRNLITETVPDDFNPYLHHHAMIVDGGTAVFGTNNWSMWGFYHNDEDTMVTNNSYLVGEFKKTFDYFYKNLK